MTLVAALGVVLATTCAFKVSPLPSPAVVFYGSAGTLHSASGLVVVRAQLKTSSGLDLATVARGSITSGKFRVPVPESSTLSRAEGFGRGVVNFDVAIIAGSRITSQFVPVPLTASAEPGNVQADSAAHSRRVTLPPFPAFRRVSRDQAQAVAQVKPDCAINRDGPEREDLTRIGEVHVNDASGLTMRFNYSTEDDATVTVGASSNGTNWSADGSITLTDTLSTDGGFTVFPATIMYVDAQMYYQKYEEGGPFCGITYLVEADHSVGTSQLGSSEPNSNPYGGCVSDPFGKATLQSGEDWAEDTGQAITFSGIASVFGFTFGGHVGFTTHIIDHYYNNNSGEQYLCGTNYMPDVNVIYSDQW